MIHNRDNSDGQKTHQLSSNFLYWNLTNIFTLQCFFPSVRSLQEGDLLHGTHSHPLFVRRAVYSCLYLYFTPCVPWYFFTAAYGHIFKPYGVSGNNHFHCFNCIQFSTQMLSIFSASYNQNPSKTITEDLQIASPFFPLMTVFSLWWLFSSSCLFITWLHDFFVMDLLIARKSKEMIYPFNSSYS